MESYRINEEIIELIKIIKSIFETAFMNEFENRKKKFNDIFPNFTERLPEKKERSFNLNLFDEVNEYYKDLIMYSNYYLNLFHEINTLPKIKFKSSFVFNYFSILIDILINILENNKNAYLDNTIKFDFSILCEILAEKNERLIYSNTFFFNCVNELKDKYHINLDKNKNIFIQKINEF